MSDKRNYAFKKGERVRIKSNFWSQNKFGLNVCDEMKRMAGKVCIVSSIPSNYYYGMSLGDPGPLRYGLEGNRFTWDETWLEEENISQGE